jgi:hypothetical protein
MQQRDAPPPLGEIVPSAPKELVTLIMRMLAKAPEARPAMSAVAAALRVASSPASATRVVAEAAILPLAYGPASSSSTLGRATGQALDARGRAVARRWPLLVAGGLGIAVVSAGLVLRRTAIEPPLSHPLSAACHPF